MAPDQNRLQYLFNQYHNDLADPAEISELWKLMAKPGNEHALEEEVWQLWGQEEENSLSKKPDWDNVLVRIHEKAGEWENNKPAAYQSRRIRRMAMAAAVLLLGAGIYLFSYHRPAKDVQVAVQPGPGLLPTDILPGHDGATLTLANGKKITLDSTVNGVLAQEGEAEISNNNGRLQYSHPTINNDISLYNTMETARGRQYQLGLSDGSKVWLNAGSSITYPASFTGKERKVTITGEAYFEVAKGDARPFVVAANGMEVKVQGTHFNVNAYADETTTATTLLEGSVKVSKNGRWVLLSPGQQSLVKANGSINVVKDADVTAAVAWKNGYFSFDNTDIKAVMRQLSRWYAIDISYAGNKVPEESFWGDLQRNAPLSSVLRVLEKSGVKFNTRGNKIEVLGR